MTDSQDLAKAAAGRKAAELIQSGMLVGLGTGTTATYFIARLIERVRTGLEIRAVATSERSQRQAREGDIPMVDVDSITQIDITVDGADEIDREKRMIKGGGGALLREKIVASMSREMVIVVDSSKRVEHLGRFPLPVEIVPFAYRSILFHLNSLGYNGSIRQTPQGTPYRTDNGNLIYDIHLPYPCQNPEEEHERIRAVTGVVDTGFFIKLAGRIIVGYEDGRVEILP